MISKINKTHTEQLEALKQSLQSKPLTLDEAKVLLYAVDNNLEAKISDILIKDSQALQCHWKCSVRNHGPVGISLEAFKEQILNPVINPGNPGHEG